ncbi:glycoside hydrolase family 63 protein [Ustulina deusta]|nr:glycoside hydrolase family 63 protein [Ustulina deusta]
MYRTLQVVLLLCAGYFPSASFPATTNASQLWTWGPYRPNLYFGLRPQIPETLLVGLMWADGDSLGNMLQTLRDTCEQDDGMEGYGWITYDTRHGGIQAIHDSSLHIDLTTEFFKAPRGDSWGARIAGTPQKGAPANLKTALVFHVAHEQAQSGTGRNLSCERKTLDGTGASPVQCYGYSLELGTFEFHIEGDPKNHVFEGISAKSQFVSEDKIWQAKSIYVDAANRATSNREGDATLLHDPGSGNMHFIQVIFEGSFQLHISYRQKDGKLMDAETLNGSLSTLRSQFPEQVDRVFPRTPSFTSEKHSNFSQSIISNLLGGLGFFHGDSVVDYSQAPEYAEVDLDFWTKSAAAMERAEITTTPKMTLISHVPSRPFFPRGFLWDEGFHLLPIIEWDLDLAVLVLQSWFSLMDEDGWIGREQILGPEARSKVPKEFQVQYPHFANPPTLIILLPLIISKIINPSDYRGHASKLVSSPQEAMTTLKQLFSLASRQYLWFRRTQAGNFTTYPRPEGANTEGYRWKGRTPTHTLTSGLDDYPRAEPPHPGELHVDALAWVGAAANALRQTADHLGEDSAQYTKQLNAVRHNLDAIHWDLDAAAYCDATIDEVGKFSRVCHIGYVSLLPFILGHIDENHPNLAAILDSMSDPQTLSSPYGLRSLSAADENYAKGEDYWRGAIWINLNVLAVSRLRTLNGSSTSVTRAHELALDLRQRLVNTVFKSWADTGFFWEQYDDRTGMGRRSRAFTGWTACIILLMGDATNGFSDAVTDHSMRATSLGSVAIVAVSTILVVVALRLFRQRLNLSWAGIKFRFRVYKQQLVGTGLRQHRYEEILNLDESRHQ